MWRYCVAVSVFWAAGAVDHLEQGSPNRLTLADLGDRIGSSPFLGLKPKYAQADFEAARAYRRKGWKGKRPRTRAED